MTDRLSVGIIATLIGVLGVAGCTGSTTPPASLNGQPTATILTAPATAPLAASVPASTSGGRPSAAAQSAATASLQPADDGARVTHVQLVDARMQDIAIDSPAVSGQSARLLLPAGFDAQTSTKWPVLYLLSGADGDHEDWTRFSDVEELTATTPVIVVMPDAGNWGWYSDWWNHGRSGPPEWETFHLTELRQIIERNWNAGAERAVAGYSMGGYGAMEYAARQPDLFVAAAAYSGILDPLGSGAYTPTGDVWGDPLAQADVWREHDPLDNVSALVGKTLFVSYGDGHAGPFDNGVVPEGDLESWVAEQDARFVARLKALNIPATVDTYVGTHSEPYWERELQRSLPLLLAALQS